MKNLYHLPCNIAQTLNIIGDKWTLLILRQLMLGNDTYKEIQTNLEGIPSNLLSDRLKGLEEDELIYSELYQQHPPRYRYLLTERGEDLNDVFNVIFMWNEKHMKNCNKYLSHSECGHKIELQYYCSYCGKAITKNEFELTDLEKASANSSGEMLSHS